MTSDLDDVVREFVEETRENLDRIDRDLVSLERAPEDTGIVARVFRAVHTIKGTCGFLGFARLEAVSHAGENVLGMLRDEEIATTPSVISSLLELVDAIRVALAAIDATGTDGDDAHATLIARLNDVARGIEVAAPPPPEPTAHDPVAETSLRVEVALLDRLMNLVGELVLARNQIAGGHRLERITAELQEAVMKTRMQPIKSIWHKLPRVVRDLATTCGKRVELVMDGEQTELDKTLIEAIKDPLTHLIRNAVDHGIEVPERRVAAGKPPVGRLALRAYHEGGQVNIEVTDDGAGLHPDAIRTKGLERGLVTGEQAARMSDRDVLRLIFLPGFSTAAKITSLSGRGVGMDVVRTNIERIGGTIGLGGKRGTGTTMRIKIPLTLAIVPALIVTAGANRYAIPQAGVLELVRFEGVEQVYDAPVLRLRGRLLPLVYLGDALAEPRPTRGASVVVLEADGRRFGLVVDAVHDTQEIVVKPIGRHVKQAHVFAGATIMGDGRVALILDVAGVAKRARMIGEAGERRAVDAVAAAEPARTTEALLLLRAHGDGRLAIPLARVARLEDIPRAAVEISRGERVVQYRGDVMPLVEMGQTATDPLPVVVLRREHGHVGLVVDEILDIVAAPAHATDAPRAVIAGRITELVDVDRVMETAGVA